MDTSNLSPNLKALTALLLEPDDGEVLDVLGIPVRVKVSAKQSGGAFSLCVTEDGPRMGPPFHLHHKEEETFMVLEGEYRVRVNDDFMTIKKGQVAYFPRGVPHCYANAGDTDGRLLVLTTPGGFDEFFRDIDALCKSGPPTMGSLHEIGAKHRLDFLGPPIFA